MSKNSRMSNSMNNRTSNKSRMGNSMSNWMSNSVTIGRDTIISHISNISIVVIGMVVDSLDAAIRKVDRVRALDNTGTIIGLSLVEGSTRVVISNSISVRVGRNLSKVRLGISANSTMSNHSMAKELSQLLGHGVVAHGAVGGYAQPDLAEVSPYSYTYAVADDYSGAAFNQAESNDGTGVVQGSYSVNLP